MPRPVDLQPNGHSRALGRLPASSQGPADLLQGGFLRDAFFFVEAVGPDLHADGPDVLSQVDILLRLRDIGLDLVGIGRVVLARATEAELPDGRLGKEPPHPGPLFRGSGYLHPVGMGRTQLDGLDAMGRAPLGDRVQVPAFG